MSTQRQSASRRWESASSCWEVLPWGWHCSTTSTAATATQTAPMPVLATGTITKILHATGNPIVGCLRGLWLSTLPKVFAPTRRVTFNSSLLSNEAGEFQNVHVTQWETESPYVLFGNHLTQMHSRSALEYYVMRIWRTVLVSRSVEPAWWRATVHMVVAPMVRYNGHGGVVVVHITDVYKVTL